LAHVPTPQTDARETSGLTEAEVYHIPDEIVLEVRAREDDAPLLDLSRTEIVRPGRAGNLVFLVGVLLLALWGIFLGLYLLKSYLGINLSEGTSLGWMH
jgi:hypothetical protein